MIGSSCLLISLKSASAVCLSIVADKSSLITTRISSGCFIFVRLNIFFTFARLFAAKIREADSGKNGSSSFVISPAIKSWNFSFASIATSSSTSSRTCLEVFNSYPSVNFSNFSMTFPIALICSGVSPSVPYTFITGSSFALSSLKTLSAVSLSIDAKRSFFIIRKTSSGFLY